MRLLMRAAGAVLAIPWQAKREQQRAGAASVLRACTIARLPGQRARPSKLSSDPSVAVQLCSAAASSVQ